MTEEIMPKEDRMGKMLSFIGGCIAGVAGVFAVAVMSELSPSTSPSSDSPEKDADEQEELFSPEEDSSSVSGN
jgi:hypothetical protein